MDAQTNTDLLARLPWWKSPWLWAGLLGIVTVTVMRPVMRHVPDPPPVLGTEGAWKLRDTMGKSFGSEELAGTVHVVAVITPSGDGPSVRAIDALAKVAHRCWVEVLPVRIVGVSVAGGEGERGSLARIATERQLDLEHWSLLGGGPEETCKAVVGLLAPLAVPDRLNCEDVAQLAHADRLVLVDGQGRIRGYYGLDERGQEEAFHRTLRVVMEERETGLGSKR